MLAAVLLDVTAGVRLRLRAGGGEHPALKHAHGDGECDDDEEERETRPANEWQPMAILGRVELDEVAR